MEPRVQYARAADGVSIAFWTQGDGLPVLQLPPIPFSQVQLAWQLPEDRQWAELWARTRRLIRYDARGTGLSERSVRELSLETLLLDVDAVVDCLALARFVLVGNITSGPMAIAYGARHPDRVSHLILWSSWARSDDVLRMPQAQGLLALMDKDWELFTETAAHAFFGWSAGELAHRAASYMRENIAPETAKAMLDAIARFDVTDLLPKVRSATLVVHSRQAPLPDLSVGQSLAAQISDARLVVFEGTAAGWRIAPEAATAIDQFLGIEQAQPFAQPPAGTLATLLFTDMEDSTKLTQRLGDARAQELVRTHNVIVRRALEAHGGREIKHTGDGIMASFSSASGALSCAVAIQTAIRELGGRQADPPLRIRIGLNAGEPVAEERDLFGSAVQLARRICDRAKPGQILASNVVRELATGKEFVFVDRGDTRLRGFPDPVRLHELRWRSPRT